MRLAFNSVAFRESPLEAVVPLLRELGYDAIELNAETLPWAAPHVTPCLSREERAQLKHLLKRHGLQSISAHMSLVAPDPAERRHAVDFVKGCIYLACDLDTAVVHGLTGALAGGVSREAAWGWLLAALWECLDHAAARGITFALEPVVNMLVCDSRRLLQLQEDLADPRLKVNFDPSHLQVHGDDPVRAVRELGPAIVHVHIKDAAGVPENFVFPPLGTGHVDFDGMVRALEEIGYTGFLSIEYEANAFGYPGEPREIAMQSHGFISGILHRISRDAHRGSYREPRRP